MARSRFRSLDPLVVFLVLGGGLFGLYALTRSKPEPDRSRTIVVTDADVRVIYEAFRRSRLRPPTREELQNLVQRHVRDEILYREAVALGLDREDPALRRRLATKLEYLAKDVGAAVEPTEAELQAFFEEHAERFARQSRRAFEQVFFSADKRGEDAESDARALLARLDEDPELDLEEAGDAILLEGTYPPTTQSDVARDFGRSFAEALFQLEAGRWGGPIRSGFGLHVVRVGAVEPGETPPLDAVRDRVRTDLLARRKETALENYLDALYREYEIEMRVTLPEPGAP